MQILENTTIKDKNFIPVNRLNLSTKQTLSQKLFLLSLMSFSIIHINKRMIRKRLKLLINTPY